MLAWAMKDIDESTTSQLLWNNNELSAERDWDSKGLYSDHWCEQQYRKAKDHGSKISHTR